MGWYDGMQAGFATALEQMVAASGGRLGIGSGFRSVEVQAELYADAVAKYGEEEAGNWVAPPGRSNHGKGQAADLAYNTDDAQQWAHDNAARFGLVFPMEWEPWHIEPSGIRESADPAAYTTPPVGFSAANDATRRGDIGYQLTALNNILLAPNAGILASPTGGTLDAPQAGVGAAVPGATAEAGAPATTVLEGTR